MARYIDADKLIEHILTLRVVTDNMYGMGITRGIERAETAIQMQPTADVVPKSEVEKIFDEIEKIRLKEITRCEVMREKEYTHAQRNYWEGGEHSLRQLSYWIAELKKKYI